MSNLINIFITGLLFWPLALSNADGDNFIHGHLDESILLKSYFKKPTMFDEEFLKQVLRLNQQNDEAEGKEFKNINDLLTPKTKQFLETFFHLDRSKRNIFETVEGQDLNPSAVFKIASFAPILGNISSSCQKETELWLNALRSFQVNFQDIYGSLWPLKFLDFGGGIPNGLLTDTITFNGLTIPYGNRQSLGSYRPCLDLEASVMIDDNTTYTLKGGYSIASLGQGYFPPGTKGLQLNGHIENLPYIMDMNRPIILEERLKLLNQIFFDDKGDLKGPFEFVLLPLIQGLKSGFCLPASCSSADVSENLSQLLSILPTSSKLQAYVSEVKTKESIKPKFSDGSKGFIAVLSIVALTVVLGTVLDFVFPKKADEDDPKWMALVKCFSLNTNVRKLFNTDVKAGTDQLNCIHGMRSISMAWVVLGHCYGSLAMGSFVKNPAFGINLFLGSGGPWQETVLQAFPSVDTFFFMSGLLVSYLSLIALQRKKFSIIMYYIHRYIRLTIPLAFAIGIVIYIAPYFGSGPYHSSVHYGADMCHEFGWRNLLYINNFYGGSETCLGVTWYLANDMQFFWYAPLVFFPLWYSDMIGMILYACQLIAFTVIPAYIAAHFHISPSVTIQMNAEQSQAMAETGVDPNTFRFDGFYITPYTRFQPYLVGILLGYILFKTKGKNIVVPKVLNVFMWLITMLVGCLVVYPMYHIRINGYSDVESVLYLTFSRIAWSLALAWVTFACVKGYGGVIDSFLSWGPFHVISRLTYFMYLIHMDVVDIILSSLTFTVEMTKPLAIFIYIGLLVIVGLISIFLSLFLEAPFIGFEKIVMEKLKAVLSKTSSVLNRKHKEVEIGKPDK